MFGALSLCKRIAARILICALPFISGCAALDQDINPTQIDTQWLNPSVTFDQKTITGILVVVATDNPTNRRLFEDSASDFFALHGIPAQPSYQSIPNISSLISNGSINLSPLLASAKKQKFSNVLLVKKRGTKTNVVYNPGMTWGPGPVWGPGPFGGAFGGPFGPDPFWGGWAIPPSVTQQQIVLSNAELLLANDGNIVWTAALSTLIGSETPQVSFQGYISTVYQAIMSSGFLIPVSAPANQIVSPKFTPQTSQSLPH